MNKKTLYEVLKIHTKTLFNGFIYILPVPDQNLIKQVESMIPTKPINAARQNIT